MDVDRRREAGGRGSELRKVPAAMEGGAHEFDGSTFKECFSLSWRNPYVLRLAFSAGIGGLLFGYDTGACVLSACLHHCTFISSPAKFS